MFLIQAKCGLREPACFVFMASLCNYYKHIDHGHPEDDPRQLYRLGGDECVSVDRSDLRSAVIYTQQLYCTAPSSSRFCTSSPSLRKATALALLSVSMRYKYKHHGFALYVPCVYLPVVSKTSLLNVPSSMSTQSSHEEAGLPRIIYHHGTRAGRLLRVN